MRATVGERGATGATFDASPARPASRAGSCTTTSAARSGCSPRSCGATATCGWSGSRPRRSAPRAPRSCWARWPLALREMLDEMPEFLAHPARAAHARPPERGDRGELAELHRRVRGHLGGILAGRGGRRRQLAAEPEVVAEVLFSLADGLGMRMLAEPERDFEPTLGRRCSRPPRSSPEPRSGSDERQTPGGKRRPVRRGNSDESTHVERVKPLRRPGGPHVVASAPPQRFVPPPYPAAVGVRPDAPVSPRREPPLLRGKARDPPMAGGRGRP